MTGAVVARHRPALGDRERDREGVLARAVVAHRLGPPAGVAVRGGGGRVARLRRPAAEVGLGAAGRAQQLAHTQDVGVAAAVRRARDREMVGAEAEALRQPGAHRGQRLERLRRRAEEHRRTEVLAAAAERPCDAMLALDRRAAVDADDGLPGHDARIW
jgi:hypothetical protein